MPIYSRSLLQLHGFSGTAPITVPAGYVIVVRCIDVYGGGSLGGQNYYFHGNEGQAVDYWENVGDSPGTHRWRGRQVFESGQTFDITTDDPMDVTVSGYLLAD